MFFFFLFSGTCVFVHLLTLCAVHAPVIIVCMLNVCTTTVHVVLVLVSQDGSSKTFTKAWKWTSTTHFDRIFVVDVIIYEPCLWSVTFKDEGWLCRRKANWNFGSFKSSKNLVTVRHSIQTLLWLPAASVFSPPSATKSRKIAHHKSASSIGLQPVNYVPTYRLQTSFGESSK